jgi:hypothetical protein
MALPTLDSVFASAADLPRRQMLAQWLVNIQYSGSVADYATLPEYYLWAKIAVAAGAPRGEADYISLPKNYAWSDIYNAVAGLIPPSSVLVSGAGSGVVNGIYTETGENNGKKYYNQSGFSVIDQLAISWSGVEWIIHDDIGDGFYASTDDVEFPWQVTSWAATNGEEPTPTVAEIPQPSPNHTDWSEKQALGHIAAAYRADTANPANLATYIDWPWRYQVASIITNTATDSDAQAFITTSGATDKEGIDQFVKGVKNLGLYNSMVCWPLRSTQNAGTGTTAYSLGGLGTFNGTLVNGPTWGVDGLTNSATGGVRATVPFTTTHSGLVVYNQSSTSGSQTPIMFGDATDGTASERRTNFRTDTNWFAWNGSTYINHPFGPSSLNSFRMAGYGIISASTLLGYNNGATTTISSSTANISGGTPNANVGLMAAISTFTNAQNMVGVMAFGAAFDVQLSLGQHSDFYTLYRATLGKGLDLP